MADAPDMERSAQGEMATAAQGGVSLSSFILSSVASVKLPPAESPIMTIVE